MQFKKKKKKKSTNKSHLINIISPCLLLCFLYFNKHEKMSLKKKKSFTFKHLLSGRGGGAVA